jgi:hypothetical protein
MGNGLAEHRRLLVDHIDGRIDGLRADLRQDLVREIGAVLTCPVSSDQSLLENSAGSGLL